MRQTKIPQIRKRDGRVVEFEQRKITEAIFKASVAAGYADRKLAEEVSDQVVAEAEERFGDRQPLTVEDIQDIVEKTLIKNGYTEIAKLYILYRQRRAEIREAKKFLGVTDDLKLTVNAVKVLTRRYLRKDEKGNITETPSQMCERVAKTVASTDALYRGEPATEKTKERFYRIMADLEFLPNSPTLMNAGTEIGQLSACFVIPVEDSMEGIFEAAKVMAIIHKTGGGTGFSFSRLRPAGDIVGTTKGIASGPNSFMRIFDISTDVIKQGGRRRGANMGILRVEHPDILEFIALKGKLGVMTNFNLSVAVTDDFMRAVETEADYGLINPRTGEEVKRLRAKEVFDQIVFWSWRTGDPGLVFIDEINRHNPTPQLGAIESTNPCGEQPLLPYESCNLGSINLPKMLKGREMDWEKLRETVWVSVHFLDNVIDGNKFPMPQIEKITKANRKIGLGVMGLAEVFLELEIPYDSQEALDLSERWMSFITEEAEKASMELAEERGSFPNFERSTWPDRGYSKMRNATLTTIAPTGTISIIAGVTSGIEPLFAVSFVRDVMNGTRLLEVNPIFEATARTRGFYSRDLMMKIAKAGSIQTITEIPEDVRRVFVTALDIDPEWHVRMQAAFQRHVDNAVSKTVNLRQEASVEDVRKAFLLAYQLKCKGITVYRYGSKPEQVLNIGRTVERAYEEDYVRVDSEYAGGCPATFCAV